MLGLASSWYDRLEWITQVVERFWAEDPLLVVALFAPCAIAVIGRSATAVVISALLAAEGFFAAHAGADAPSRLTIALIICGAGVLVCCQGILFRRARAQLNGTENDLSRTRDELAESQSKYQREVFWRRASERATDMSAAPAST